MWWFELLKEFGKTPAEWGELDAHERYYLEAASRAYNKRVSKDVNS